MKYFLIIILPILTTFLLTAQDIAGQWNGILNTQESQIPLILNVTETENGFNATIDYPDKDKKNIPVTISVYGNSKITFEIDDFQAEFSGDFEKNKITGTFKQTDLESPLIFSREVVENKIVKRPQEPVKPYPYFSEEVSFYNDEAKITLDGTLTLPPDKTDFPVVILISGSSPHNRNEEVAGHKPFLVISDHLTKNGIGVFRYDDRGVDQSEGKYEPMAYADRTSDVESAIAYLKTRKDINSKKIGLIGHSEGGLIASRVASKAKNIDFVVLMAAPGISGYDMILLQRELINNANKIDVSESQKELAFLKNSFDFVINNSDLEEYKSVLSDSLRKQLIVRPESLPEGMKAEDIDKIVETFTAPWFLKLLKYDPGLILENVKCPVLAINGTKDLQIPPKENLGAIREALEKGGNKRITIKEFPNLNHLFQEADTGLPKEYSNIEQTISPDVLDEITNWIKKEKK